MSDIKEILVPDVGGDEVEVIELSVAVGDTVAVEDALVSVETDKASMDIPSSDAGVVKEIKVAIGDKISEGDLIVVLEVAAADSAPAEQAAAPAAEAAPAPAAEPATASSEVVEITVPDIGQDGEVDIIDVLVAAGDEISAEDGLITLETDKATMDVPAPQGGKVVEVKVAVGDKVGEGSLVLLLEVGASASAAAPAAQAPVAPAPVADTPAPAAAPAAPAASAVIEVSVPDIGQDGEVDVIDVLVAAGDDIAAEDGLITLETDKATMDVPAPQGGKVVEVKVAVGDKVGEGSLVLLLETQAAVAPAPAAPAVEAAKEQTVVAAPAPQQKKAAPVPHHPSAGSALKQGQIYASPAIRRLAREFGVDLSKVKGTGKKARIMKEDVQSYVKYELSRPKATANTSVASGEGGLQVIAQPKVDFSKFGEIEQVPLTRIQKISGPNLHRNWVTIPHVTQFDEADITEVEAFRKQQNVLAEKKKLGFKITPLVFILKAAAAALREYPVFNSSLSEDGESLIMKKYVHIGVAVDTPNGLVVPVVRDVDQKGIYELSKELLEISAKARDGKLTAKDMQGSCFTISSLGGIGGTAFTPIVNAPDVAILGVSKSDMKPKWNGSEFVPRLMLPLSLSYDHRVIDGALAARFSVYLSSMMTDIRQMIL
ncbi:pyruvate dehydrogenase complex dihydrolipoyllysine-residue acetyltransferase [Thalassotalea sp. HSM 43]|uniref:pyruvate dehydrogenase complex dihydrolipoyllysine-residue acetyltransferase n=1 Tax=Thalassotalea sp. HSM 43 TaxID=2552945 RepID=UPI0010811D77|nr:pyruvate dehydrogenase complex dihydrolipoyllysine-residue acetyltransferase [Thalassotalea sp. HSM 43]QBY04847.1 pyruvate dehydrogenase complex dihydrolipoyllysine-residue acetyltransferase [Thalassotalea sp. HSM 43]